MSLEVRTASLLDPDALALIDRLQGFYAERYGGPDVDPMDPAEFEPPDGLFLIARQDSESGPVPVACGAWRRTDVEPFGGSTAEIKRMFVVPEAQRSGLASVILAHLEDTAARAGVEALILTTGLPQPEAIAFYLARGFEPIERFGYYRDYPDVRAFGKRLRAPG